MPLQWNKNVKPQRYAIWYTTLVKEDGKWKTSSELHDALRGNPIEAPSNMYEDGGGDMFDICNNGIGFIADDPDIKYRGPQSEGVSMVYFVPINSFAAAATEEPKKMVVPPDDEPGYANNFRFSPNGKIMGFIWGSVENPEARVIVLGSVQSMAGFDAFREVIAEPIRLPPSGFEWMAGTNDTLILAIEDAGRKKLARLDLKRGAKLETLVNNGTASAFYPLKDGESGKLLVTSSSIVDSSLWQIIDTELREEPKVVSSATKHGTKFGLSHSMLSEFWFEGENDTPVHCFIVKPTDFDKDKKYPWVLMPHGGPESSWMDSWSTRVRTQVTLMGTV